jgi:hypothetical protein
MARGGGESRDEGRCSRSVGRRRSPRLGCTFPVVHDASGPHLEAIIDNESEWPAADLAFEMHFRNGRVVRDRVERLAPDSRGGQPWRVVLGDPPEAGHPMEREPPTRCCGNPTTATSLDTRIERLL